MDERRTILIAGCGFLGGKLGDILHADGWSVTALTFSEESAAAMAPGCGFPVLGCDIGDARAVGRLTKNLRRPDAIVHCASSRRGGPDAYRRVYLEGARNLIGVLKPRRFVFTSSTSVYSQTDGSEVVESSPANPARETSKILRKTEDLVLGGDEWVARLSGLYGPGRSVVLQRFLEGTARIEATPAFPDGRLLNQIHRDDAASALRHILSLPGAVAPEARLFNVSDSRPLTQRECYAGLALRFGLPLPPEGPPDTARKRAWTHKRVGNARLRASGWNPRHPSFLDAVDGDAELTPSIRRLPGCG